MTIKIPFLYKVYFRAFRGQLDNTYIDGFSLLDAQDSFQKKIDGKRIRIVKIVEVKPTIVKRKEIV